jgi:signal transduction histidine kinase
VQNTSITIIFFFYGLAFFSMGLAITLEVVRAPNQQLRFALQFLAIFGLVHCLHEWLEMFEGLGLLASLNPLLWHRLRISLLALSYIPLCIFGAALLSTERLYHRLSLIIPLVLIVVWGLGLLMLSRHFKFVPVLWDVADVWSRYVLALPSALLASAGLIAQARSFRKAGSKRFCYDCIWVAIAFAVYGIVGQTFVRPSPLPPSTIINQHVFERIFGFPVQLLRAMAALVAAFFMIRFLRLFEVERLRQMGELQSARLKEVQHREAQRGEFLKRLVSAQEAERQRIARELHDETGQALTAIGLGLRAVSTTLHQDVDKAEKNLSKIQTLVASSLDELRRLISDLHPSHLDDLGLAAALRWYAGEVENRVPLKVLVEVEGEPRSFASPVKIGFFRIAQEALTNVIKHADATTAIVRLHYDDQSVSMEVIDDGCGFDTKVMAMDAARPSWGLAGMQERAFELGGRFDLQSQPGEGTQVRVIIPHERKTNADPSNSSG